MAALRNPGDQVTVIVVRSVLSANAVFEALEPSAQRWRGVPTPERLGFSRVSKVQIRGSANEFELEIHYQSRHPYTPVLIGHIETDRSTGSRIQIQFRPSRSTVVVYGVFVALILAVSVLGASLKPLAIGSVVLALTGWQAFSFAGFQQAGLAAIVSDAAKLSRTEADALRAAAMTAPRGLERAR